MAWLLLFVAGMGSSNGQNSAYLERHSHLREIVAEILEEDSYKIADDTKLSDLEADSLDRVEICMEIESAFQINIADIDHIKTFGELAQLVEAKIATRG